MNKFAHSRFEPAGFTRNPDIPIAKSVTDYIFRWLGMEFIPGYRAENAPQRSVEAAAEPEPTPPTAVVKVNGHRAATIDDLEHPEGLIRGDCADTATPAPADVVPRLDAGPLDSVAHAGLATIHDADEQFAHFQSDAPACDNCGALTVRCGTCYRCFNCGNSMGCS